MKDQNFLNNSFFKEGKFGFTIDLDPVDIQNLKVRNGKYRIEAKRPRNNPEKWYLAENTWEPTGGFKPKMTGSTASGEAVVIDTPPNDVWSKAKDWQQQEPSWGAPDDLPF